MAVLQSDGVNHTSDLILRRNGTEGLRLTSSTVQVSSINDGPLAGFRNLLINANPTINQRGYVSGTNTTSANQYTLDRWKVVTSGQNISFTDSNNTRTVTAPAGGVEQVIEGVSILSGTYTLNWTGTATATVNGTGVAKGGNVTLTGGSNCTVRFSSGTFSLPQLEVGTVATLFERRLIGTELALCQRYFQTFGSGVTSAAGTTVGTGGANEFVRIYSSRLPVAMRSAPSATFSSNNSTTGGTIGYMAAAVGHAGPGSAGDAGFGTGGNTNIATSYNASSTGINRMTLGVYNTITWSATQPPKGYTYGHVIDFIFLNAEL